MRKRNRQLKNKWILLFFTIIILASCFFLFKKDNQILDSIASVSTIEDAEVVYPKQYSDTHITKNAVEIDPRFRNITMIDREELLSNVVSSLSKNTYISKMDGPENGTWLWTPLLSITPEYRSSIIAGAKKNGIKHIYLSIDSYLDVFVMPEGFEKEKAKKEFDQALEDFIAEAHQNNIVVDAEAGWQNWAEKDNSYKPFAVLDYAINFNKTHTEKLRGFQYDVEVYLLPRYKENKREVLSSFVSLMDQIVAKLDKSDLEFSVVIPDFYDGESGETPRFLYRGKFGHTFDHLLSVLERRKGSKMIVMSYRNFSLGEDGTVHISLGEIKKANKYSTKIIIAQETGDVPPPYITFFNTSRSYYDEQARLIESSFLGEKSFGGIATHYINSFLELK